MREETLPSAILDKMAPPIPAREAAERRLHDDRVIDPYGWLRNRDDPRVRDYIEKENAFSERALARIGPLQRRLYDEMLERVDLSRITVPAPHGPYEYYSRNEEDKPYAIHCRRLLSGEAQEEVILDENAMASGKSYFAVEFLSISPDHQRCVFGVDTIGDERLSLFVKQLTGDGTMIGPISRAAAAAAWANDGQTLFSIDLDDRNRPFRLVRHRIAQGAVSDDVVFEELDDAYRLRLHRTESGRFLILTSWAHDTTELHYLNADQPTAPLALLHRRMIGVEAYATHHGDEFYILNNEDAPTKQILTARTTAPMSVDHVFVNSRPDVEISYMQAFSEYFVICERSGGLLQLRVIDLRGGQDHVVALPEPAYALYPEDNREFETTILRFGYSSLITPYTLFDYDMAHRRLRLRQQSTVKGYDPTAYRSERIVVRAADGARVPVSLVYREGLPRDGSHPALLYGYGAYGYCLDAEFSSLRLSLLDRGFVYAIAHVRGGGELGEDWHAQGKGRLKQNSIDDFIACAEHLVREGYTSPARLAIMGESAGGLLAAAAINERPELFAAVVVDGPFVDVVNTLADETLPFTVSERKEWGNPLLAADYAYLSAYSPYENVKKQDYPVILALCSFNDPRVPYWEGMKWAAHIREMSVNERDVLVKVRLDGGHQGMSDRFAEVEEWSLIYSFLIDRLSANQDDCC